ncbi:MAG TPA: META domain-containing protein [Alphaproteobacteria bacterium]|jgi:heat shock protein HslJ
MKKTFVVGLALLLGACAMNGGKGTADNAKMTMSTSVPLAGTSWTLNKLGDVAVTVEAGQREPFLSLDAAEKRASGFAGCNMFSGPYQLSDDGKLTFGPLAMTRMACAPGMSIEGGYANALRDAKTYSIADSQLTLMNAEGKPLATFNAK